MVHLTDAPGNKSGSFTDGNPFASPAIDPTVVGAKWLNMVQEELVAILTAAGVSPDSTSNEQLSAAIVGLIETKLDESLGRVVTFTAPAAYTAGEAYVVGAVWGVARTTVSIGQQVTFDVAGIFTLPKVSAETFALFDRLYWNTGTGELTTDGTGLKHFVGVAYVAAASGQTQATVHAWSNHDLPPVA